jgi:hypothetical protein
MRCSVLSTAYCQAGQQAWIIKWLLNLGPPGWPPTTRDWRLCEHLMYVILPLGCLGSWHCSTVWQGKKAKQLVSRWHGSRQCRERCVVGRVWFNHLLLLFALEGRPQLACCNGLISAQPWHVLALAEQAALCNAAV